MISGCRTGVLFHSFIKPRTGIHPKALEVHGLTNSLLAKAHPVEFVLPSFMQWVGRSPLVSHNAKFDVRFLEQDLKFIGLLSLLEKKQVFCTMKYFRQIHPHVSYTLNDLASFYNIPLNYRLPHTALVDAQLLSDIFLAIFSEIFQ